MENEINENETNEHGRGGTSGTTGNSILGGTGSNTLAGGTGVNILNGGAGNDDLVGDTGNDTLNGGDGDDILNGVAGNNTLIGGNGNDTYMVHSVNDHIRELAGQGTDTVDSDINYTLGANLENLTLTGTATTGTGNALNNVLTGNVSNNTLSGGAGDDTLDGVAGNNTLIGGTGNDTYMVHSTRDHIRELAGQGTDTVDSDINYKLGANLENLTLTGTATVGTGNALNNVITGNASDDTLSGGAGNDTLIGGAGSNTLIGGRGADHFVFDSNTATTGNVIADFVNGQDKIDLSAIDAITGAGTANDAFTFDSNATSFTGAGQVYFSNGILYGNTDANTATAEFQVALTGVTHLAAADFIL